MLNIFNHFNHVIAEKQLKQINELLSKPSFKESQETELLRDMSIVLNKKSAKEKLTIEMVKRCNLHYQVISVN